MKVGGLQLQHLKDTGAVDLVRSLTDLLGSVIGATKACLDQLLAVLVEKIKCGQMSTARDLDQLGKAIADLSFRKGP